MMTIRITILILLIAIIGCSQSTPTKRDSAQIDSLTNILEKLAKEWNPDSEPWFFIEFRVDELDMIIKYGQKSIHPFLAEYERKIQFISKRNQSDTLPMAVNTGGKTWIDVFYDPKDRLLILEDSFGRYSYDLETDEYSENLDDLKPCENKVYVGRINGKSYPLRYEPKENK